ncbi:MAG: dimethyl sulfoxide reductase anchor subunit [Verrucomicrobia bacterium]|nr:dimethyl sulfoxide reductase anchor subunit [Verrucomicrobiota bacterium]
MPPVADPSEPEFDLISLLLEDQQRLTAVEKFSQQHHAASGHLHRSLYQDLIPLSAPGPGEQYGFEVDLDKCSGCKACVVACHSLNGLDEDESWRNVGLLTSRTPQKAAPAPTPAVMQHVTTTCHHCVDPACLNGCPVLAYEKDPLTGIVRHLDDQCIGCQYCVMKCPYDVPKYSDRMGIVRKCDMCQQRLGDGEAPACVQACPTEAIRIQVVNVAGIRGEYLLASGGPRGNGFLPDSPAPDYTLPTTRFLSTRPALKDLSAADADVVQPAPAHVPLVFLLVLSQWSVGLALAGGSPWVRDVSVLRLLAGGALATVLMGLGLGALHLGQPFRAWRVFLGWRRSWFSREAILFGLYSGLVAAWCAASWQMPSAGSALGRTTAIVGLAAVWSSIMVYVDTRRAFWAMRHTAPRFLSTTVMLGAAGFGAVGALPGEPARNLAALVFGVSLLKVFLELILFRHLEATPGTPLAGSARLLLSHLARWTAVRLGSLAVGGLLLPGLMLSGVLPLDASGFAFSLALLVVSEFAERFLFFRAVVPEKMPGGVT